MVPVSPALLTREALAKETGRTVRVRGRDDLVLTVQEVTPQRTTGGWSTFSLVLSGPAAPALDQGTHALELGALGGIELFLVPIEPGASGARYEAVFNRAEAFDEPQEDAP